MQDMYSPSRNISFKENKVSTMVNMKNTESKVNVREKVNLQDAEHTKICNVYVTPTITDTNISKDMLRAEGDLNLNFIMADDNEDSIVTAEKKLPFSFTQEIDGLTEESKVNIDVVPTFREFVTDNGEITAKVDLGVNVNSYNLEDINVIDNIEELEVGDDNPYSMIIYFVKKGDTLWKIAKKYKSTVEDIARVNNIEEPAKIDVGMQLFIPKYSMCRT